jgi:hypothetical protein
LKNGALLFTNKKYKTNAVPKAFEGFEFLASPGKVAEEGSIIPSKDGLIYIIAPAETSIKGWLVVENSEFTYDDVNNTKLSVYQKKVSRSEC